MAICKTRVEARGFRDVIEAGAVAPPGAQPERGGSGRAPGLIRFLRLAQVIEMTGLGKTKIYELQADGSFPPRVQITGHSVGWVESEVQEWLASRVALSRARQAAGVGGLGHS